ncbi:MAG: prepilin-type N-terminal cleavage/methylation domain-containing protein [Geminicoccaceae bacterium]
MRHDGVTPRDRRRDRGFTLLEVLVALAVLGVVLTTLFRLAGDSLVQYSGREARLRLALAAEAAMEVERLTPGATARDGWPADIQLTVERQSFAAVAGEWPGLAGSTAALGDRLDWLVVRAEDAAGRSFTLEAAVPSSRWP